MSQARNSRRVAKKADKRNLMKALAAHPCGECTACCTSLAVRALDKPEGTECPNLGERGCSTYDIRPKECREFNCVWKFGFLDEKGTSPSDMRPDKLGVMFDITAAGSKYGRQCLVARETIPGSLQKIMSILMELAADGHVIILHEQGQPRRLMGNEEAVREAKEFLAKQLQVIQ